MYQEDMLVLKIDKLERTIRELKDELRDTNRKFEQISEINDKLNKLIGMFDVREQNSLASQVLDGDGVPKSDFSDGPKLPGQQNIEDLFR